MIGCGQAAPGQQCVPNDVALSAAMRGWFPTVDAFGTQVSLGDFVLPALLVIALALG